VIIVCGAIGKDFFYRAITFGRFCCDATILVIVVCVCYFAGGIGLEVDVVWKDVIFY
jgi:hypothetical protein